jgi:hypothetical protein
LTGRRDEGNDTDGCFKKLAGKAMGSSQKLSMAFLLRLGDLLGVRPVGIYEMKPTLTDVEYRLISIRKISFAVTVTAKWDTLNISVR